MKKKGITTWIRKKKVRYAAAGTLCLAAAIGILTLGLGIGSKAESLELGTGPDINFDTTADGDGRTIYLIDSAELISKLGQASADQTKEKTFREACYQRQHTGDRDTGSISGCALWYGVRYGRKSDH